MTLGAPNIAVETPIHVPRVRDGLVGGEAAEERISVATQRQLMWWRFRKHRLALVACAIVLGFYAVVILAGFLAYADPEVSDAQRGLIAPQPIYWLDDGGFHPYVLGLTGRRDPRTFKRVYVTDETKHVPLTLFAQGFEYRLLGLIPTDRHLLGVDGATAEESLFLLGTDLEGRDVWSRLMYGTQTPLTIGLLSVALSLVLGA